MADRTRLADDLAEERSRAVRSLLASPLLDSDHDPDAFRLVGAHSAWLIDWFDVTCGWTLSIDRGAGFARLGKRSAELDSSRRLMRSRGSGQPFDRRRYQLLCLCCGELVRHPVTTVGLLAGAIAAEASLDTSRHAERGAFVDALRALLAWGALRVTAGDVDTFLDTDQGNAILTADTARLHRLLTSAAAPSLLGAALSTESATRGLADEPRYGDAARDASPPAEEQRLRWVRHTLARKVLDDPVAHVEDMSTAEREYLANPTGRRWLRDRVGDAGFELEERTEGLIAIDTDAIATDRVFPAPHGNAHQLALLLIDQLRTSGALTADEVLRFVDEVLARFPSWARSHREEGGPHRLADAAVRLLLDFGLVRRDAAGRVIARPVMARYRVGEPTLTSPEPTLFEGDS